MPRCKPGEQAFIVKPYDAPENLGRVVLIDRATTVSYGEGCGPCWIVIAEGSPLRGWGLDDQPLLTMRAVIPDDGLLPIRPEREPESIDVPAETYAFG